MLEVADDWQKVVKFRLCCDHHQGLLDGGMTEQQVFEVLMQTTRDKEAVRAEAKRLLGLPHEEQVPYQVEADGSITVLVGDVPARADVRDTTLKMMRSERVDGAPVVRVE